LPFQPQAFIEEEFDSELDSNRNVWRDADRDLFKITSAVLNAHNLLVFTETNCFKVGKNNQDKFNRNFVSIIPEINWKCFYMQNQKNVYLIGDKGKSNQNGLCYFDLERFFDKDRETGKKYKDITTWLQFTQVGIQSVIDYGHQIERLAYIKSYQEIILIPNLHLNQVSLIGQKEYDSYQAIRSEQDALYALYSQDGRYDKGKSILQTWDIITGKKVSEFDCSHQV